MAQTGLRLPLLTVPSPNFAIAMTTASPESAAPGSEEPEPSGRSAPSPRRRNPLLTTVAIVAAIATLGLLALFSSTEDRVDDASAAARADADTIVDIAFTTTDGGSGTLSDYEGRPLVVNFFASWCPPCRAELPDFEAVHRQRSDDVTFVGVNQDFNAETWQAFVAEADVSYDTVFQPNGEIWEELGTGAMPTTAFISPQGQVVNVWAGVLTDDKLNELIDEHLVEKP